MCQNTHVKSCLLLWSDGVKRSIFEEIVDVVVIDLDVGHKNAVTTVIIHILRFACLFWADHVHKLGVGLLPKKQNQRKATTSDSVPSNFNNVLTTKAVQKVIWEINNYLEEGVLGTNG